MLFCTKFCKVDKCFEELFMRDETGQKSGSGRLNREGKPLSSFLYRTVIGTCYCK